MLTWFNCGCRSECGYYSIVCAASVGLLNFPIDRPSVSFLAYLKRAYSFFLFLILPSVKTIKHAKEEKRSARAHFPLSRKKLRHKIVHQFKIAKGPIPSDPTPNFPAIFFISQRISISTAEYSTADLRNNHTYSSQSPPESIIHHNNFNSKNQIRNSQHDCIN